MLPYYIYIDYLMAFDITTLLKSAKETIFNPLSQQNEFDLYVDSFFFRWFSCLCIKNTDTNPFILQSKHFKSSSRHTFGAHVSNHLYSACNRKRVVENLNDCGRCGSKITISGMYMCCVHHIIIQSRVELNSLPVIS